LPLGKPPAMPGDSSEFDRVIGFVPAEGEAPALPDGHVFVRQRLPELIDQTGLAHTGFSDNGKSLPSI